MSRVLLALAAALALTSLAACTPGGGPDEHPTPAPSRRDPSPADIDTMRGELAGIEGVTSVDLRYFGGSFGTGPSSEATLHTDAADRPALVRILDTALRLTWQRPDFTLGALTYVVESSTGARATGTDLGTPKTLTANDLQRRYGPPGTPLPSSTAS